MATKKTTAPKASTSATKATAKREATRPTFVDGDKGKQDRFKFYALLRVNKALKLFKQLSNLSNRTIYSYTPEQANKMLANLESGLAELKVKLSNTPQAKKADTFRFDD